ncbi:amino acid carrier protein [Aequorivita lipolytica]|uniref:Amino acid carrier protein n=1 Tax=Aequorivita lipolytica TaxID=153267 RepID=A0A5C6YS17_9FLAO|nr:amino acid carrier protein [Aequorivita lipolytica]TXD70117.1 amino acid carrier protein [Aequorivita lipolytica]SRX50529.1 Amino-acid carrier protein AlsT [Aequorivita lipolytica]
MVKPFLFFLLSFLLITSFNAQTPVQSTDEIKVSIELKNPSSEINNGTAQLLVDGGNPPYRYKWTDPSTSLNSNRAIGLIEGMEHSVTITDSNGNSVSKSFIIPAESIVEVFNSNVQPAVDFLGAILFWDPFASSGIYDPVVYISKEDIPLPQSNKTQQQYRLKKWLLADRELVKKDQEIALLENDNEEIIIYAQNDGRLKYLLEEGTLITSTSEEAIVDDKVLLGVIQFNSLRPSLYPNGDVVTSTIPFIVIWLILGSIFFTFRLKFVNIRGFKHSIELARGKYDDPNAPGSITHFQAMATAVSATVGLGNIAGVAVAISLGGAGATFWMFLAGFFGMSLKFAECSMGVKYRFIDSEGRIFGGPMNYLRYGLEKRNLKTLGKFLAAFFAILGVGASFGGGNMLQSNQAFKIVSEQIPILQGQGFWFGVGFAILVGIVIIGGIKSIAKVTEKVVPVMAILYVVGCLVVIGSNIGGIGNAFLAIYDGAFSADALKGGFIGVLIVGLQRAAFSSEAGVGSAAIAHSASKTNHPIADGFTSLVEPFIDTMVVCTMTALVLIFTGKHQVGGEMGGVELTADAFGSVISWFPVVLAIAVFLFAFSTMVSWSYYGMRSWTYLFGRSKKGELLYKIMYLCFVVLGASVSLGAVLSFADMMILAMSFPNIIGLYILSPEIYADMNIYWEKLKKGKLYISAKFAKT